MAVTEQQAPPPPPSRGGPSPPPELSLDALLQRIVETAAGLTGARYAALGVVDPSGTSLERFLTTGIDEETYAAIGEIPRGRGILGAVIRERGSRSACTRSPTTRARSGSPPATRRCTRSSASRSCSAGGVREPVPGGEGGRRRLHGRGRGRHPAARRAGRGGDRERQALRVSTRWLRQLESLNEIGNALASELELEPLLALVAGQLRELLRARIVLIALPTRTTPSASRPPERASAPRTGSAMRLGLHGSKVGASPRAGAERARRLRRSTTRRSTRGRHATSGSRPALYVPLIVHGRAIGVIAAHDKLGDDPRFDDDDIRSASRSPRGPRSRSTSRSGVSRDAIRRVVEAQELERKRLARELHDETGQALTSILLGLKLAGEAGLARGAKRSLRELVVSTLQDVRRLAVELRPSALDDFGLAPALERLVDTYRSSCDRRRAGDPARRRAAPDRDRDDALPHRPGGAHERRQARGREG